MKEVDTIGWHLFYHYNNNNYYKNYYYGDCDYFYYYHYDWFQSNFVFRVRWTAEKDG